MSSPASTQSQPAAAPRRAWRDAWRAWAQTDGLAWIYLAKALCAAFLALGVSMALDLPAPKTAMTTVFIVMQPQSGPVLAKSFYRLAGTFIGLIVTVALVGLFAQQPELFLLSVALWIALCTAGAARNRNFRSYGFVLAGYTAALIGLPSSQAPDTTFMTATTRVSAIVIGILSAGFVSALVFPRHTSEQMRDTVRKRFSAFVEYVSATLAGKLDRAQIEKVQTGFAASVVGFEAQRSTAVFEQPELRLRAGRLARLNSEFMAASSRYHALHQLMNRLRASSPQAVAALEPYFREIAPLLVHDGAPIRTAAEATHVEAQLSGYREALPRRVRAQRAQLETEPGFPLLDFDTATELLYRFITDLHDYAATYASLSTSTHERERWIERYEPHTNLTASVIAGLRAAVILLLAGAFWIVTAWPSGLMLTLNTATICALVSSSPQPARTAAQMTWGTALAVLAGFVVEFWVYPHIDGFVLLCAMLTPFLAFGVWLSLKTKHAGAGMGYLIFFCFLAGPDLVTHYDPAGFMNDALALVLSMLIATIAFAVLFPPTAPWLKRRLFADLREQVVLACGARLADARGRFDSRTRDLMFQAHTLSADQPDTQRDALRWMFAVLEVGHAVLDLRHELAGLPRDPAYGAETAWRRAIESARAALAALFRAPQAEHFATAFASIDTAIAQTRQTLTELAPPRDERRRLQRILSQLHFIRSALLDPDSPLAAFDRERSAPAQPGAAS